MRARTPCMCCRVRVLCTRPGLGKSSSMYVQRHVTNTAENMVRARCKRLTWGMGIVSNWQSFVLGHHKKSSFTLIILELAMASGSGQRPVAGPNSYG